MCFGIAPGHGIERKDAPMKTYEVVLTLGCNGIVVEAENEEDAVNKAMDSLEMSHVFICDAQSIEEVEDSA